MPQPSNPRSPASQSPDPDPASSNATGTYPADLAPAAPWRLAVARLWYEASSFTPLTRTLEDFRHREWIAGAEAPDLYAGTATEMGAVVDFLARHPDWQARFLRCTSAVPGGPVLQADLDIITDEIVTGLATGRWDAVYLSLHGALLGTGDLAPDLTLLRRVRAAIGPQVPLAVSFDMHACLPAEIADQVDILTGYRSYPHVDMHETAMRALTLLDRRVRGEIAPRVSLRPLPMLPPSHEMRTEAGPMAEMVALALDAEAAPGIHDVSIFGGFAYADTPHAQSTICVCHEAGNDVSPSLDRLGAAMLTRRAAFLPDLPDPTQAIAEARRLLAAGTRWPVAVLDPADNPLSGGIGDTTALLRALVDGAADLPAVFCFLHDPALVAKARRRGPGATLTAAMGGRIVPEHGPPVTLTAEVERLTDGRFRNLGPMERGMPVDLGATAVLRAGSLRIVVTETCQSANDPGWCALHGIDLSETAIFAVKAKNHFRAAFGPLCGAMITTDAPGPAPADLRRLCYRHVPAGHLATEGPA